MYLSKLHLHGFKSFLNKTDLDFGEGITVVVGPNGCGKSNIVDAIRWVLGEQKTSLLRSKKMEDIIFNGTKNHQPLSFCTASMLINNNLGVLPLEYNDVEISRRLYRSGESEFYINKTLCRLKDIQNLFVNTGMSSNAYSIIELKMVDTILSNNAEDRRQMFEEAASINHYKQQKHAALRKIKATQSDMERVNDIIIEIKNTVNTLGLQMKRYKRHSKLTGDLKELEIQMAKREIQIINDKLAPIENKLDEIKGYHSSLSGQMNLDDTLVDEAEKRFQKQKSQFNTCQGEKSRLENDITDLRSKRMVWSEKISGNENQELHFKDELDHCGENIAVIKRKIVELKNLKDQLAPNVIAYNKKFKETERNYLKISKEHDQLLLDQQENKKQSESKFLIICTEQATIERFIATASEKEGHLGLLMEKVEKYLVQKNHCQAEMNLLQVEVEKYTKESANIIAELEKQKKQYSKAEDNIMNMKNTLTRQHSRMNTIKTQIQFYGNMITTHEDQPEGVKEILLDQKQYPYVLGVLSNLINVDDPYQAAVESALGEFNHYLVVDTWNNANKLIQNTNHRLSVIVLESIGSLAVNNLEYPAKNLLSVIKCNKQLNPLLHILMGNVCILPKKQDQPQSGKTDEFDWVSEGGCYFQGGYIFRSSGKGTPSIIGPQQKLEKLTKDSQDLGKEIKMMEKEIKKDVDTADSISRKLNDKRYELDLSINKLNESEQQYTRQDYILMQQQERIREIKEEIKLTEAQIIAMNIRSNSTRENVDAFRKEFDEFSSIQDAFKEKLDTFHSKSNILQQDVQEARIKLMEITKEKEGLEDRIQTFSSQDKDLNQRIQKYKLDLKSLKQENKEIYTYIGETKNKLKKLSHTLKLTSSEKDKWESNYNKTYVEVQRLQSGIRERQKQKDEYLDGIREYELQIAEGKNDIKRHRQRILNLYHENLQDTVLSLDDFDLSANMLQIDKIRDSLERIGPVNMAVTDEYAQESDRYDFLTQQLEDLEESEKILKETIDNLDSEAQSKFMETFNAIQNNFTKTYSSFFDGGEGHLRLVGKDDPLEAEIEIIAQPPGKKTQTLRMLSAGEKALTAIALLFAIYLVKPSPFCILDEVDAPLDDTNIGKFAKALKDFSNKTQFIVVTHNKLTMEKADYMYGITQQEEGVSKIVSVKLNETRVEDTL